MKYFRHCLRHEDVPRNESGIFCVYAESAAQAVEALHYHFYEKDRREEEGPADPKAFFEYIDERELATDEEPVKKAFIYLPIDGTDPAKYPSTPTMEVDI